MTHSAPSPDTESPPRNVELKARLRSLEEARETARRLATQYPGIQHQTDTYFAVVRDRLKLREIDSDRAELIWYDRPDRTEAKSSRYLIVPLTDPAAMKILLTAALGVRAVVVKRREIFLYQNVRIHLDQVERLGDFLEFEAVLGDGVDQETGRRQVAFLAEQFGLWEDQCLSGSYGEMILALDEKNTAAEEPPSV